MPYLIVPFVAWMTSGIMKFIIFAINHGNEACRHMSNRRFPSTYAATVLSMAFLVGIDESWQSSAFSLATTFLPGVVIDATRLCAAVDKQLQSVAMKEMSTHALTKISLWEKVVRNHIEILSGLLAGFLIRPACSSAIALKEAF